MNLSAQFYNQQYLIYTIQSLFKLELPKENKIDTFFKNFNHTWQTLSWDVYGWKHM
jgi:hypothetical protein